MSTFNAAQARAKRPCPLWVDAFQRDTQHLEADEIGAYLLLLMAMWTRESCDFPDDDTRLARVCRVSVRLWKSRVGPTIRAFLTTGDGVLFSKRLREEATKVERRITDTSGSRFIPLGLRAVVMKRDGARCAYCGDEAGPFHLDHRVPWARGGETTAANLSVACAPCNLAKGARTPEEWTQ